MKKTKKISTKIKLLGALLILLMLSIISTTIYLNQQNVKDALAVNIVGKQRMLTQQISKNIFYIYYSSNRDFYELNSATDEFINALETLRYGDSQKGISEAPTSKISTHLSIVEKLWKNFLDDIQNFKLLMSSNDIEKNPELKRVVDSIYKNNPILLKNVDMLVSMYTEHSEKKTESIKIFQYISIIILLLVYIYSLVQLRVIESHAHEFMQYSKKLVSEDGTKLKPLKLENESESEIIEVNDTINCFINKINSAVDYSNEALLQSQQASQKLEELTDEFDTILDELKDNSQASRHLNNSENIAIESTEDLINSTKRLQNLKDELEKLTITCQDYKA